jgi:hypothetical protein
MTLQELFGREASWIQFYYARDKDNNLVEPTSWKATKWSLYGAFQKCYNPYYVLEEHIRVYDQLTSSVGSINLWNDDPARTIEDVRQLVKELNV